jgi:hypothetical protein
MTILNEDVLLRHGPYIHLVYRNSPFAWLKAIGRQSISTIKIPSLA